MAERKVLTTGEIAKYCGVNFRTVIRWIQKGHLRAYKLPGRGDHRVEIFDFIAFLKDFKMPVPDELSGLDVPPVIDDKSPQVLIVEDEPVIVDYIETIVFTMGYRSLVADDGFKAGVMLATHKPDLVTLDLGLPGLGGFEVLRFIRESSQYANTRILVISGKGLAEINMALKSGADDFLAKPFSMEDLKQKLQMLLAK